MAKKKEKQKLEVPFNDRLILFRYFLNLFSLRSLQSLGERLNHVDYEGYDENQNTKFYYELDLICAAMGENRKINHDVLHHYDENICRYIKQVGEKRGVFKLKYFQYICLLFTEMYLDRFFTDRANFLEDLNVFIKDINDESLGLLSIPPYTDETMNKLAFMCATGSGKTLIMHINILQFMYYYRQARRNNHSIIINKIILLSPNEGMSFQHLEEFKLSSIPASLFQKDMGFEFSPEDVIVIDMNKLKEEGKVKTVSIDSFEQNNLVLVDEAHRGLQGDVWYDYRSRLSVEGGFSFEYSATFKQALKSLNPNKDSDLLNEYGKSIIIDYSYKYFYGDGYGKEYRIYNLQEGIDSGEHRAIYLTGCLLSFYQQLKLFTVYKTQYTPFEIENPLLVFVGNRVTTPVKSNSLSKDELDLLTDIEAVLDFLDKFVNQKSKTIKRLEKVIAGNTGIIEKNGDLFSQNFIPLRDSSLFGNSLSPEVLYTDILKIVFNSDTQSDGPRLHVVNLKQVQGEIGLKIGEDGSYFGVINIGDTSNLLKNCDTKGIVIDEEVFQSDSLFRTINQTDSRINILIGSRKFTEGWNCWRVSTMGLINFAKGEGSQAIQLFGRGVRLHGFQGCLKRSNKLDNAPASKPKHIAWIETLTIFGIKANYMAEFRKFLEMEELPPNDGNHIFNLPVISRYDEVKGKKLKVIRVQEGINFKKQAKRMLLSSPDNKFKIHLLKNKIVLDCRSKVQSIDSTIRFDVPPPSQEYCISNEYISYLDFDEIFKEIERYKNEKYYYNISLTPGDLKLIMESDGWYGLIIPEEEIKINTLEKAMKANTYAVLALQSYMDKFYKYQKEAFEEPFLEYQDLRFDDNNFVSDYTFIYNDRYEGDAISLEVKQFVEELSAILEKDKSLKAKKITRFSNQLIAFDFPHHLYVPLIFKSGTLQIQISPVSLNEDEMRFVYMLAEYLENNTAFLSKIDLYLLRNKSKVGMGFFEGGNFYPDYVLWLNSKEIQYISFIDPKGLRMLQSTDIKVEFYKNIKKIETRLQPPDGEKKIILNSFILSGTKPAIIEHWWEKTKQEMEAMNVFCLDNSDCIEVMMKKILVG
jgi:hypothetical protein